jgi:hypothetical protein
LPALPFHQAQRSGDVLTKKKSKRYWRRIIFFRRHMPETPDSPSSSLGDVLAVALNRTVGTSLDSLVALRQAVRNYTQHQKQRGVPLDRVMVALSAALLQAEDDQAGLDSPREFRDPDLARQLRAWCSADYLSR